MKCDHSTQYILLESSGELTPADRARLDAHLAGCPSCRSYRSALLHLGDEARADEAVPPPARFTVTSLLVEARRREEQEAARRQAWFGLGRRPVLAFAAAAVAAFAIGFGIVVAASRPHGPVVARAAVPAHAWAMDEWVDVRMDLLSDDLATVAEDMQRGLPFDLQETGESLDEIATRMLQVEA